MVRQRDDGAEVGRRSARRFWTRLGTLGAAAHVFYELGAGVGMPLASRAGAAPTAALWGASSVVAFREAGRQPPSRDAAFAVLNGMFLSAVVAHLTGWPRRRVAGLPWLTECEGLTGRVLAPYNVLLYVSGVAAVGGLAENRRGVWGALLPLGLTPWLRREQWREISRLRLQARREPRWWNRRLR